MKQNETRREKKHWQFSDFAEFDSAPFSVWKEAAIRGLKGASFEKVLRRTNLDGLLLEALYSNNGEARRDGTVKKLIRGAHDECHWDIGQIYQCSDSGEYANLLHRALNGGQNEIRFAFSSKAEAVSMSSGPDTTVFVSSLSDFSNAIPTELPSYPQNVAVRFHSGAAGLTALSFWIALHRQRGWDIEKWHGSLGFAPISTLATTGRINGELPWAFDEAAAVVNWMASHTPNARTLLVDGTGYHNGGGGAALEMACCLAEAAVYMREISARCGSLEDVANTISIQMATGDDFFEDIAKMRGMRLLFGGVAKLLGCTTVPMVELWSRASTLFATRDEPLNNVLRSIVATLSGALGGAKSIHAAPFNESYSETGDFAARISRNIQLILQKECRIGEVIDPCGGSYYVEHLTEALSEKAWKLFCEFEAYPGGYIGALQSGRVASLVDAQFESRQRVLNKRKYKMVGVNDFVAIDDADNVLKTGERLSDAVVSRRDNDTDSGHVTFVNKGDSNGDLVAQAVDAVLNGASFDQVNAGLKGEVHTDAVGVAPRRLAEGYENLRKAVAAINARRANPCSVLLLRLGTVRETKARADFSRSFFNTAGFEVSESSLCKSVADAHCANAKSRADVSVICSTDERYGEVAAELATAIRKDTNTHIVLAGHPGDMADAYLRAGIDDFIFLGADHYTLLASIIETIGESNG